MASSTRHLLDVLKGLSDLVANAEKEENDLATLREAYSAKDKMYREECKRFESFKGSHRDCQTRQDKDKAIIEKLREEKVSLENALREKEKELEENRQRLSKIMGMKIMDNNPEIADLSDPNRPTKLGERYGELYDNEWTDAYEILNESIYKDEKKVVTKLYDIFKFVFQYCYKLSREQEEDLKRAMLVPLSKMKEVLPDFVLKQFKDNRKLGSNDFLKSHFETFQGEYRSCLSYERGIDSFVKECYEISWLMNIQDPPIEIDTKTDQHDRFDSNVYKAYTVSGTTIDFVVWPTARLHQGGPILFKGVAQCIQRPSSSTVRSKTRASNDTKSQTRPYTAYDSTRTSSARKTGSDENNSTMKPTVTNQPSTSKNDLDNLIPTLSLSDDLSKSTRNKNQSPTGIHRLQSKEAWTDFVTGKEVDVSPDIASSATPETNYDQFSQGTGPTSKQYGNQSVRTGSIEPQQNLAGSYSGSQYSASGFSQSSSASPSYTQTNVNTTSYPSNVGGVHIYPVSQGVSPNQGLSSPVQPQIQQYKPTEYDLKQYYSWIRGTGSEQTRYHMGHDRFDAVRNHIRLNGLPCAIDPFGKYFI